MLNENCLDWREAGFALRIRYTTPTQIITNLIIHFDLGSIPNLDDYVAQETSLSLDGLNFK